LQASCLHYGGAYGAKNKKAQDPKGPAAGPAPGVRFSFQDTSSKPQAASYKQQATST